MYYSWDWKGAESGYQRAIALNAIMPRTSVYSNTWPNGTIRRALAASRAKEIDPLAPVITPAKCGSVPPRGTTRRRAGQKLREMSPQFAEVHEYLKRVTTKKECTARRSGAPDAEKTRRRRPHRNRCDQTRRRSGSHETYWRPGWSRTSGFAARSAVSLRPRRDLSQLGDKTRLSSGWKRRSKSELQYDVP